MKLNWFRDPAAPMRIMDETGTLAQAKDIATAELIARLPDLWRAGKAMHLAIEDSSWDFPYAILQAQRELNDLLDAMVPPAPKTALDVALDGLCKIRETLGRVQRRSIDEQALYELACQTIQSAWAADASTTADAEARASDEPFTGESWDTTRQETKDAIQRAAAQGPPGSVVGIGPPKMKGGRR